MELGAGIIGEDFIGWCGPFRVVFIFHFHFDIFSHLHHLFHPGHYMKSLILAAIACRWFTCI